MRPPISACEELEGRPARQVMRFQTMAPASAAMIIVRPTPPGGLTSPPIVSATFVWSTWVATMAPARLSTADIATATRGVNARVLIDVATALAVSWKPLVKSKPSATATVIHGRMVVPSGILDGDALDDIRHVLAAVEPGLEQRVQILELDDLERLEAAVEELRDGLTRDGVADVLDTVDLEPVRLEVGEPLELADGVLHLSRRLENEHPQPPRRLGNLGDAVEDDGRRDLVDVVEDVVEAGAQCVDVLSIEGGDEGPVQRADDLVGHLVAAMLPVLDLGAVRLAIAPVGEHRQKDLAGGHDAARLLLEEIVETALARHQRKAHFRSPVL